MNHQVGPLSEREVAEHLRQLVLHPDATVRNSATAILGYINASRAPVVQPADAPVAWIHRAELQNIGIDGFEPPVSKHPVCPDDVPLYAAAPSVGVPPDLPTEEDLAEILRAGYRSIVLEADEWRPLAAHVLALIRRYTAPVGVPLSDERRRAPWPDFMGQPIRHGDRLEHPNGQAFTAVWLNAHDSDGEAWRAIYDDATVSRLCLQIGDKGRAVLAASLEKK